MNSPDEHFLEFILNYREAGYLKYIKKYYRNNPGFAESWIRMFDPNILRKNNLELIPIIEEASDFFGAKYSLNLNDHIGWNIFLIGFLIQYRRSY